MAELGLDVGFPHWVFGESCFAFVDGGRVAFVVTDEGLQQLGVLERDGAITMLDLPHTSFESLRGARHRPAVHRRRRRPPRPTS